MTPSQRAPFVRMRDEDIVTYNTALANMTAEERLEHKRASKRGTKSTTQRADRPKSAMSSFMHYVCANRASVVAASPELSFADVGRAMGASWRLLDDSGRRPYVEMAIADRKRYQQDMVAFRAKVEAEAADDVIVTTTNDTTDAKASETRRLKAARELRDDIQHGLNMFARSLGNDGVASSPGPEPITSRARFVCATMMLLHQNKNKKVRALELTKNGSPADSTAFSRHVSAAWTAMQLHGHAAKYK